MPGIEDAIRETLDAIGDDPDYADARHALTAASTALTTGTTAEAHQHLDRALALIDQSCPI
ncbi:MAG TPA: hypothetical protein VFY14_00450 [Streptomyces sp.]|nr:hypothetical protein [Streptomyces sp.]